MPATVTQLRPRATFFEANEIPAVDRVTYDSKDGWLIRVARYSPGHIADKPDIADLDDVRHALLVWLGALTPDLGDA